MIFGNNYLTLEHRPSGVKYSFTAQESLQNVKKGELVDGDGAVKVSYADKMVGDQLDISRIFTAICKMPDLFNIFLEIAHL